MQTIKVEEFFGSITDKQIEAYNDYWGELKPQSESAIFRRYLFAYMSVHTTWENNCKGYNAIKDFRKWTLPDTLQLQLWNCHHDNLLERIRKSRVGLHFNRTNYIAKFSSDFWSNPSKYCTKNKSESWTAWRDRIEKTILGLGKAKTSFAIEMLYPTEAEVVCMDTHLFQIYGLNQNKDFKHYSTIEKDWINRSKKVGVSPYIARCLFWDKNQNKKNSRYWSKVLEK